MEHLFADRGVIVRHNESPFRRHISTVTTNLLPRSHSASVATFSLHISATSPFRQYTFLVTFTHQSIILSVSSSTQRQLSEFHLPLIVIVSVSSLVHLHRRLIDTLVIVARKNFSRTCQQS